MRTLQDKPDEENVGKECLLSKVIKSILSTTEETPFYKEGDSEVGRSFSISVINSEPNFFAPQVEFILK